MQKIDALVPPLLDWFAKNARDLPWRRTSDPYAVWVSEIMLQQTQVKTVIPYWDRWMREFPNVESLARAPLDRILKLWEGLGYYTRARNLRAAAQIIVCDHGGIFPTDFQQVLTLPGVGRYTAGAICSIAFNQPVPILDGNVIRVLTRLFGIARNPREKKVNAQLWKLAERLVHSAKGSDPFHLQASSHLNQSLMELGATVCTPRNPNCPVCPVRRFCVARERERVHDFPNLGPRASTSQRHVAAFIIRRGHRYFVSQRPGGVVNAHLWEFPNVEVNRKFKLVDATRTCFGRSLRSPKPLCVIRHTITRFRITLSFFTGVVAGRGSSAKPSGQWCTLDELEALAFPSAHRKALQKLISDSSNKSHRRPK